MQFDYLPGLVESVHDGELPTAQAWRDSLAQMDRAMAALRAEIAQVDAKTSTDPWEVRRLADKREVLEEKLRKAERKRKLFEMALAAGLVSDPSATAKRVQE
jgi:hypothetical protein